MDIDVILARAKRNRLYELAGDSYRGPDSELVVLLNRMDFGAILGIQSFEGSYTIITKGGLLTQNKNGDKVKISFAEALPFLKKNAMQVGKGGDFEFVEFGENGLIWMKDGATMCAIWNISMLVKQQMDRNLASSLFVQVANDEKN